MRTAPNKRHNKDGCGGVGSSKGSQGKEEGMNVGKAKNSRCPTFIPEPLKGIFTVTELQHGRK